MENPKEEPKSLKKMLEEYSLLEDLLDSQPEDQKSQALQRPILPSPQSTFESFDWEFKTFGDKTLENMLNVSKNFIQDILKKDYKSLVFSGPTEVGKTFLLGRMKLLLYKMDISVRYSKFGDDYIIYLKGYELTRKLLEEPGYADKLKSCTILFVEEFMSESFNKVNSYTEIAVEKYFAMLNDRAGKITIMDTNKSITDIDTIDPRIASRLFRNGSSFVDISVNTKPFRNRK
jgi:DNA replication protein DnaC